MTEVEKLARLLNSYITMFSIGFVVIMLWLLVDRAFGPFFGVDETDSQEMRSNMVLRTDHGTGCQYLQTRHGGITPRLDPDGKQICN